MACAAIPAIYDYLIVLVLFPLEILFQMMESLTQLATKKFESCEGDDCQIEESGFDPIAVITEPIQQYILVIDKDGLGQTNYNGTFVQYCKNWHNDFYFGNGTCEYPDDANCPPNDGSTYMTQADSYNCEFNEFDVNETFVIKFEEACHELEKHMFVNSCMSDEAIGGICFALSFVLMYGSVSRIYLFEQEKRLFLKFIFSACRCCRVLKISSCWSDPASSEGEYRQKPAVSF